MISAEEPWHHRGQALGAAPPADPFPVGCREGTCSLAGVVTWPWVPGEAACSCQGLSPQSCFLLSSSCSIWSWKALLQAALEERQEWKWQTVLPFQRRPGKGPALSPRSFLRWALTACVSAAFKVGGLPQGDQNSQDVHSWGLERLGGEVIASSLPGVGDAALRALVS